MDVKPVPKPRSIIIAERPVPAPRKLQIPPPSQSSQSSRSLSPSESSQSEKSDDHKSTESRSSNSEKNLFKNLGTSSRQLKDEISEKMTVKGKAMISSTLNASIRLEKSMKNLLTRRLTSASHEEDTDTDVVDSKKKDDDRCVSMPACDDIFSSISFYSPLRSNLKSIKNEEDLTGARYSPPPPVYPPPPLPDESIYDELQSVISGSSRYDTLSSTVSERFMDFPDALSLSSFPQNRPGSDSDQSLNLSEVNGTQPKTLSRSDSWTFYDSTSEKIDNTEITDDLDTILSGEDEYNDNEVHIREKVSTSPISVVSVRNSLYENWTPKQLNQTQDDKNNYETRPQTKSLLFEFDPYAKVDDNTYGNYENNDLMLLEALLAISESPSSGGSMADLNERDEDITEEDPSLDEDIESSDNQLSHQPPPAPPKRFDSLPKHQYDQVELVEIPEKSTGKNPALLPKLVHLTKRKQPAVPPRKTATKNNFETTPPPLELIAATAAPVTVQQQQQQPIPIKPEERKKTVMQKLKKLRHDSTAHVRPNVMNFMKTTKLLRNHREHGDAKKVSEPSIKMERPKTIDQIIPVCHRGIVYRSGVGMERAKDLVQRAAVLSDQKLCFFVDKGMTTLKEVIQLETVQSVHLLQDVK